MTPSEVEEVLPLSPLQEAMLFQALYQPTGPDPYLTQLLLDLDGPLAAGALQRSAQALVQRHPALRASFRHDGVDRPVQLIHGGVRVPWRQLDLGGLEPDRQASALAERRAADRAHRFDLTRAPLLRFTVFRLGDRRHRLLVTRHHLLADGWSGSVLLRELLTLYGNGGDAATLPPVPPYRDYLAWLGRQDRTAAELAWREVLAGLDEPTLLVPGGRGRAPAWPDRVELAMPAAATGELVATARRHGLTLGTTVQGAWALVLAGLTGRTDVVFGTTVSGRPPELSGVESMVGLFINTLPVRVRLDPAEPLRALLTRVQQQQAGLLAHQHLGLVEVQQLAGHAELFDTTVVYQSYPTSPGPVEVAGVRVSGADSSDGTHYPLSVTAGSRGDHLVLRLSFRPDLLERDTVEECAGRLCRLLDRVATDPDRRVAAVDLLDPPQRRRLLAERAGTPPAVVPATLPELVEEQAARTPEHPAVVAGAARWSYRDLTVRANQLARLLVARGAGPERFVAVALPRSAELVVALLAVLKSGAAYLPLDPEHPSAHLRYLLDDAGPVLVLTCREVAPRLPVPATGARIVLDEPAVSQACDRLPGTDPGRRPHPGQAAYLLYTSGSTGAPKGVVVSHDSVRHYLGWAARAYPGARGRALVHSPVTFDLTVTGLFVPLTVGGCVLLAPLESEAGLRAELARAPCTFLKVTPSHLPLLDVLPDALSPITDLVVGGEALSGEAVRRWRSAHPDATVVNEYGPTEATVGCLAYRLPPGAEAGAGEVPIGRPTAGMRGYLLDPFLHLSPAGAVGELYLAGVQLARGYWRRAALTAERFVADPFGPPGARMYRTGDRARGAGGELVFRGRADDQVKVRGFRIELGEVESVLATHPDLAQVAATVREDRPGERRLVAYLVPAADREVDPARLREHLASRVPDQLVPEAFVVLDALPLTRNGKLDRRALPAPARPGPAGSQPSANPQEEILRGLFAEVLGVPAVGRDDDFFDLGGSSLHAVTLMGRLASAFGVELPVMALFDAPTVAELVGSLPGAAAARPPLRPRPRPEPVPLSFAQRRLWFLHRLEGATAGYHIPLAVRLAGPLDRAALQAALADVTGRHESLRTIYPETGGVPRQVVCEPAAAVPTLTVIDVEGERLDAALAAAVASGFDLTAEPPLRPYLFRLGPQESVLLLVVHHIATDGQSLGPLGRDLAAAYTARCGGAAPDWQPLPVQYADYTLWQRDWLGDEADPDSRAHQQLSYWRSALHGLPEELALPTDRPRPPVPTHRGESAPFRWDRERHADLVRLARDGQASVFMVVQAGLAALLTRLGAGTDIPLGAPVAARGDAALENLVGFFVNTLVLRTDTSGNPTFRQLLARVREVDLAGYAQADVPFERLVELLNPTRSLARHPLFQVMLAMQDTATPQLRLPGLRVSPYPVRPPVARFDLSLHLVERRDGDGALAGLDGLAQYRADLFDRDTVVGLVERLDRLLTGVAADPDRRIMELDLLTPAERRRVLVAWNDTGQEAPAVALPVALPATLPAMFEAQAAATPDAPAVRSGRRGCSYAELNAAANRLAHLLVARGAGPDQLVAVGLPRSTTMVTALLAVLKSGAGYLPVDLDHPPERVAFMLAEAAPAMLVTTSDEAARLPARTGVPLLCLDEPGLLDRWPTTNPGRTGEVLPAHTAYVIYTSGSTGRPKGVVVPHAGIVNRLRGMQASHRLTNADRVLQKTPTGFDVSVWELFWPLTHGAEVVLARPGGHREPGYLVERIRTAGVTTAHFVPSMLPAFLREPAAARCTSLRRVVCSGEALSGELQDRFLATLPGTSLYNLYGPTEASVDVTAWQCRAGSRPVPIGRPVPNVRAFVLDGFLQPVPPGVAGELYLAGVQLARCYLGRPAATAERFVACPFHPDGARLYRTGDLARWRADGQLEFLGRVDDQVQLRGFRVELGEIESALVRHPDVGQAAVAVREHPAGGPRLVAYVVPAGAGRPDQAALRAHAARLLPDYMVPATFQALAELPRTPSGKLDRSALPAPAPVAGSSRAPGNPREATLCRLFAEVLRAPTVGVEDSFFDLGGHSLLATQLASRVREEMGVELGIRSLFESPTVAALAERLDAGTVATSTLAAGTVDYGTLDDALDVLLPLRRHGSRPPLFCVHPAMGIGWVYSGLMTALGPEQPLYAVQARGLTGSGELPQTLAEMADDYLTQLRAVQPEGPYHVLGWSLGGLVAHAMATRLQRAGCRVGLLALLDAYPHARVPEVTDGNLLRALVGLVAPGQQGGSRSDPIDHRVAAELLRDAGSPLAGMTPRHVAALERVAANSLRLAASFRPDVFDGDLQLFRATRRRRGDAPRASSWRPYLRGTITVHPIGCGHEEMTQPGPIAQVARVVASVVTDDATVRTPRIRRDAAATT